MLAAPGSKSSPSTPTSSSPPPLRLHDDGDRLMEPLVPRTAVCLGEEVGEDVLGPMLIANVYVGTRTKSGTGEPIQAVAQRLVVRDEAAFSQELHNSVGQLAHPALLPVIGACKDESARRDPDDLHYIILSKRAEVTADQLLKQKREEVPPLDVRVGWALKIAQALHTLYDRQDPYQHDHVNLRHVHLNLKTDEAWLAGWAFRSFEAQRKACPPTLLDFYWKAPEVLLHEKRRAAATRDKENEGESYNAQAADVYSFGILLWELCSLKQAFTEHKSLGILIDGVITQKSRPPIPEDWPESLRTLAQKCWANATDSRPTFAEVIGRIQRAYLDIAIQDDLAHEFWSLRFPTQMKVEFSVFQPSLYEFLGLPDPKKNDIKFQCLLAILKDLHEQNKPIVTVKTFSDMLHWFGPLEKGWGLLDRINELCSKPWFFGRLSAKDAEEAVCKAEGGAFLFRFSTTKPGSYAITVKSRRGGAKHFRVYHEPRLNYLLGKTECRSLDEIIFKFKTDLNLLSPAPGSQFLALLKQDNFIKLRYDSWEDDEETGPSDF